MINDDEFNDISKQHELYTVAMLNDDTLYKHIELHHTIIGIYLEIDRAIERYLAIGCDIGFGQEMDSDLYFRLLSQKLSNEMLFLHNAEETQDLIQIIQKAADKINDASTLGIKSYRDARAAIYEAHLRIEHLINPFYLFEGFIYDLNFTIKSNNLYIECFCKHPEEYQTIRRYTLKVIQTKSEKLLLDCTPGAKALQRTITMMTNRITSLPTDEKFIEKINHSIETIIKETWKFIYANSEKVDFIKDEQVPTKDDLIKLADFLKNRRRHSDFEEQIAEQFALFLERYRTIETDLRKSIFHEDEDHIDYELDRLKENDAPWIQEDIDRFGGIQLFVNKEYLKTQCFQKHGELLIELIENVKDEFLLNTPSPPATGDVIRQAISTIRDIMLDFWDIPYCEKKGYQGWGEASGKPLKREKNIEYLILVFKQFLPKTLRPIEAQLEAAHETSSTKQNGEQIVLYRSDFGKRKSKAMKLLEDLEGNRPGEKITIEKERHGTDAVKTLLGACPDLKGIVHRKGNTAYSDIIIKLEE